MTLLLRKFLLLILDALIVIFAFFISLYFRFEGKIPLQYIDVFTQTILIAALLHLAVYFIFGLYRSLWKYAGDSELMQIFFATLIGVGLHLSYALLTGWLLPRSIYIAAWLVTFILIGSSRMSYRFLRRVRCFLHGNKEARKRVMIVGAGSAGSMLIKELRMNDNYKLVPVVVIDDDKSKKGSTINGVPIKGDRSDIKKLSIIYRIDEIILALPSAKKSRLAELLVICNETGCKLKTLPTMQDIINEKVNISDLRDVNIEDLLGRDQVELNNDEIAQYLKDEVVLVTGGGGSIGSELCRQIARFSPKALIIFDIYENNAYDLECELNMLYGDKLNVIVLIGSVRDLSRLEQVFEGYNPGVVFHAAAHKHVPLMEANPAEAVKNNVLGTLNTATCADKYKAKKFVLISTDKAVNPTNIMGATKRMAEMIIQSIDKKSETNFVAVRFGNVLGSNGSVIPLFKKQIADGGPLTITHPDITRFFMTIPEAAQLVIQAGAMARGGEIFILDMGEPVKIVELAKDLIRLSGLKPGHDIEINYTGLRPGEKLYEELMHDEEICGITRHQKIYVGKALQLSYTEVMDRVMVLKRNINDPDVIINSISDAVPSYCPAYTEAANEIAAVKE